MENEQTLVEAGMHQTLSLYAMPCLNQVRLERETSYLSTKPKPIPIPPSPRRRKERERERVRRMEASCEAMRHTQETFLSSTSLVPSMAALPPRVLLFSRLCFPSSAQSPGVRIQPTYEPTPAPHLSTIWAGSDSPRSFRDQFPRLSTSKTSSYFDPRFYSSENDEPYYSVVLETERRTMGRIRCSSFRRRGDPTVTAPSVRRRTMETDKSFSLWKLPSSLGTAGAALPSSPASVVFLRRPH